MLLDDFKKLRRLPNLDRRVLLQFALLVPLIEISLRLGGFKRASSWLSHFTTTKQTASNPVAAVEQHRRLLFLLHGRVPLAGGCLARALALWCLLQRNGIAINLRFGMRRGAGTLEVHAWAEYNEKPLTIKRRVQEHYSSFPGPALPLATERL